MTVIWQGPWLIWNWEFAVIFCGVFLYIYIYIYIYIERERERERERTPILWVSLIVPNCVMSNCISLFTNYFLWDSLATCDGSFHIDGFETISPKNELMELTLFFFTNCLSSLFSFCWKIMEWRETKWITFRNLCLSYWLGRGDWNETWWMLCTINKSARSDNLVHK